MASSGFSGSILLYRTSAAVSVLADKPTRSKAKELIWRLSYVTEGVVFKMSNS